MPQSIARLSPSDAPNFKHLECPRASNRHDREGFSRTTRHRPSQRRGADPGARAQQTPPQDFVTDAIQQFESSDHAPCAYALDFGLIKDRGPALVEFNDATALGCYGLEDELYTELIVQRWLELTDA